MTGEGYMAKIMQILAKIKKPEFLESLVQCAQELKTNPQFFLKKVENMASNLVEDPMFKCLFSKFKIEKYL